MTTPKYASCKDCDATFADRATMRAHQTATLAPVVPSDNGVTARGHSVTVLNPTPEELALRAARITVGNAIADAQDRVFEELVNDIKARRLSLANVETALSDYRDFLDAWHEWLDPDENLA